MPWSNSVERHCRFFETQCSGIYSKRFTRGQHDQHYVLILFFMDQYTWSTKWCLWRWQVSWYCVAINRYLVNTLPFVDKDRVAFQGWVSHVCRWSQRDLSRFFLYNLTTLLIFIISQCKTVYIGHFHLHNQLAENIVESAAGSMAELWTEVCRQQWSCLTKTGSFYCTTPQNSANMVNVYINLYSLSTGRKFKRT